MSDKQEYISSKIRKLRDEGMPPKQRVAVALSYARREGYDVPEKPSSRKK